MNNKMNVPLSGIIPPLVTPLLDDDVLDVEGLQKLIEHLIAGGVHALFVLGTTGESQSLSYKLRMEMIKNTKMPMTSTYTMATESARTAFLGSLVLESSFSKNIIGRFNK